MRRTRATAAARDEVHNSVSCLLVVHQADSYGIGKQKADQGFPFVLLKPTQGSGFSSSVPQPARQLKKRAFRTQHLTDATSPRLTGHAS